MTKFSTPVPPELATQLQARASSRGIGVGHLLAFYAQEGLARDALNPDEVDKLRRRHADLLDLHQCASGSNICVECRTEYPCDTKVILTEELDEYELRKGPR